MSLLFWWFPPPPCQISNILLTCSLILPSNSLSYSWVLFLDMCFLIVCGLLSVVINIRWKSTGCRYSRDLSCWRATFIYVRCWTVCLGRLSWLMNWVMCYFSWSLVAMMTSNSWWVVEVAEMSSEDAAICQVTSIEGRHKLTHYFRLMQMICLCDGNRCCLIVWWSCC